MAHNLVRLGSSVEVVVGDLVEGSPVAGVVFFRLGDLDFPESGWTDFPVVILGWWCQSLSRALAGGASCVVLEFMDGPFEVRVSGPIATVVRCDLVGPGRGQSYDINFQQLVRTVLMAGSAVLKMVASSGRDEDALALGVSSVRAEFARRFNREL